MMARLEFGAFWALLALTLVISPLLGLLTPYVALLIILPLFVVTIARGKFGTAYASYDARVFLVVFAVLAVVFAIRADGVSDALHAFNFTMFLTYGAVAFFFASRSRWISAETVAQLTVLGTAIGFFEVAVSAALGVDRAAGLNIGPIVLSNALLAFGFIGAGGMLLRRDAWGWLYLLGPVLAVAATLLTGSRGPLLALPFAALVMVIWLWRVRFGGRLLPALVGIGGLSAALGIGVFVLLQTRAGSLLAMIESLMSGTLAVDESSRQRLVLWNAGWRAFADSPWLGYGWANIMDVTRTLLPAQDVALADLPQLHNDVLNFAVGGGVVGIACYLAIISAPVIAAWRSPRDSLRNFRLFGTTMLTIVFIGGGLTDLMFGFEFHTFLFAMLAAILLCLCRDPIA